MSGETGPLQLRLLITVWRSGHTTVDAFAAYYRFGERSARRCGHLDLAVDRAALAGRSVPEVLRILSGAAAPPEQPSPCPDARMDQLDFD